MYSPFGVKTYHDMSYDKIYLTTGGARGAAKKIMLTSCWAGRETVAGSEAACPRCAAYPASGKFCTVKQNEPAEATMGSPRATRFFNTCSCCNTVPAVSAGIDRRNVLSGMIAAGVGISAELVTHAMPALAQPAVAPRPALIDVHHHIVPPFYLAENRRAPRWSEKANQSRMDRLGAEKGSRRDGRTWCRYCRPVALDAGHLVW